ncbi:MAG: hypothetical protein Q8P72_03795 [Candidatus Roizmanbacteria bacterium]|nr:hypothetical protein [Candidatus Roizmanbacteria bacterium]
MPFSETEVKKFYQKLSLEKNAKRQTEEARLTELKDKFQPLTADLNDPANWVDPESVKDIPRDQACVVERIMETTHYHDTGKFLGITDARSWQTQAKVLPYENREVMIQFLALERDDLSRIGLTIGDYWSSSNIGYPQSSRTTKYHYEVLRTNREIWSDIFAPMQRLAQGFLGIGRDVPPGEQS